MYIRYLNHQTWVPNVKHLTSIYERGDARLLECAALMYASRNLKMPMDNVFSSLPNRTAELDARMLTPLVVQHSCITSHVGTASMVITPPSKPCRIKSNANVKLVKTSNNNWRQQTNRQFLFKSIRRINSLTNELKSRVSMDWVRANASKVETTQRIPSIPAYDMLTNSDRHIHVVQNDVCEFLKCLQNDTIKTFSWTHTSPEAIYLPALRSVLHKICNQPVAWLIMACSIGLPTFEMYTPKSFIKSWKRFKNLNNDSCLKVVLRPLLQTTKNTNSESKMLLDAYRKYNWTIKDTIDWTPRKNIVDLFVFKYWYSYAEIDVVTHLADYANAIQSWCSSI